MKITFNRWFTPIPKECPFFQETMLMIRSGSSHYVFLRAVYVKPWLAHKILKWLLPRLMMGIGEALQEAAKEEGGKK